ncbi:MAG TPA: YceI family protein [Chloroflexia bacterium]|nr:YceI family protein [Chloroflexia bacterium]
MKFVIDNSHSLVEFSVKHMMVATTKGRFEKFQGVIELDDANPANSSVEATIEVTSINTHDEKRDGHLRSADFFDVENYPQITFKSTKVEQGKEDDHFQVTGDLTIHGVSREVTLDVEYAGQAKNPWGITVAGFSTRTTINRKDFGLNWNVALETGGVLVSDKVTISLEIEAALQPAEVAANS